MTSEQVALFDHLARRLEPGALAPAPGITEPAINRIELALALSAAISLSRIADALAGLNIRSLDEGDARALLNALADGP